MLGPITGTIIYLYVSALLEQSFCNKKYDNIIYPNCIYYFSIFHNAALTMFSLYTFVSLSKEILVQGIHGGHAVYMSQPHIKTIVYWFYISKYYEYFDTFLLYWKGRKPIFLQKYHHIGAVICWHLGYNYDVDMFMFGSLFNSGVHTIMYFYYLMTIFKINIKRMRMYITVAQILQLTSGSILGLVCYRPPFETVFNYRIIILFNMYIYGLLYLFFKFMLDNYFPNHR
jgi:hypothetical protein